MSSSRSPRYTPSEPFSEDFLFHLYRGSELLTNGQYDRARNELELALKMQPHDAAAQDLLAKLYFKLGVYPRAIELYLDIVRQFPERLPPRVNLALAYLKTGQMREVVTHLIPVIERDATHARAWGYLGLAWSRLGEYAKAREAFSRAGHEGMARRMEEALEAQQAVGVAPVPGAASASHAPPPPAPPAAASVAPPPGPSFPAPPPRPSLPPMEAPAPLPPIVPDVPPDLAPELARAEVAVEGFTDAIDASALEPGVLTVADASDGASPGRWTAREPAAVDGGGAMFLGELASSVAIAPRGAGVELDRGALVVAAGSAARVGTDALGVGLAVGDAALAPEDDAAPLAWLLAGWAALPRRRGCDRLVIELRDESVVLRAATVLAIGGSLELARHPVEGLEARLVRVHGRGRLAVEVRGEIRAIAASPSAEVVLPVAALVGWTGPLAARAFPGGAQVGLSGEGAVVASIRASDG